MLDQELSQQQPVGGIGLVTDESRQKQLLQEDEEEDFLDEGRKNSLLLLLTSTRLNSVHISSA